MLPARKTLIVTLLIASITVLALAAVIFVQRYTRQARIRAAERVARDITGVSDPVPAAPAWEEWQYPKGKWKANRPGLAVRISGELVRPAGYSGLMVTPDPFEDVVRYYAEKTRFSDPDKVATSRAGVFDSGNLQGEVTCALDDCEDGVDSGKARSVQAKCLVRRCSSYDLAVFLTRAADDEYTHIMLVYHPKTETALENR